MLSHSYSRGLSACVLAIAAQLALGCDDPPPDLEAGRLLTLPGDAAGAALVVSDANEAPPPPLETGPPADETTSGDASSTDAADVTSADGGAGP